MTIRRKIWELNEGSDIFFHPNYLRLIRAKISPKAIVC